MTRILNFKLIARVIGLNLLIVSASFLVCIGVAIFYSEEVLPFILSEIVSISICSFLILASRKIRKEEVIRKRDAYFTVTVSWALLGLIGATPYIFSNTIPEFTNALFESVSGFTTTGASIITDIESLPKSILFWRSLTHWIGGIGIIMLVIIILPSLKIGGYHLFSTESSFQDKIKPKIRQIGARLVFIYIGLTLIETILLVLGKMSLFESICHSFGTIATGGFSPKNTSISDYSPYIQYVIMIFMLLSGINFIIHYFIIKRDFSKIYKNEEFRFYLYTVITIGSVITATLFIKMDKPFELAFRESFFQVISIITCTGFATTDYMLWPEFAWIIIFLSMFLGGSIGSTAGGIKMGRHLIIVKNIKRHIRQAIHPNAVLPVCMNKKVLSYGASNSTFSFFVLYIFTFLIGTLLMLLSGLDGATASSSVATCMAGIGPGIGTIGPASNFAHISDPGKLILSFFMILGRLEIYSVLVLFTRKFWKS